MNNNINVIMVDIINARLICYLTHMVYAKSHFVNLWASDTIKDPMKT